MLITDKVCTGLQKDTQNINWLLKTVLNMGQRKSQLEVAGDDLPEYCASGHRRMASRANLSAAKYLLCLHLDSLGKLEMGTAPHPMGFKYDLLTKTVLRANRFLAGRAATLHHILSIFKHSASKNY